MTKTKRSSVPHGTDPDREEIPDATKRGLFGGAAQSVLGTLAGPNLVGQVYAAAGLTKAAREAGRTRQEIDALNTKQVARRKECDQLMHESTRLEQIAVDESGRREAFASRRKFAIVGAEFDAGATRLRALGSFMQEQLKKGRTALHSTALRYLTDLGGKVKEIVDKDPAFFMQYPADAPRELDRLHREAFRFGQICDLLTGSLGSVNVYWSAMGGDAEHVITERLGGSLRPRPAPTRHGRGKGGADSLTKEIGAGSLG